MEIINAVLSNDLKRVRELIYAGADVNAKDNNGNTALMFATEKGHTDCLKALLNAGTRVNTKTTYGKTALMFAAQYGHTDCVKALLDAGADINAKSTDGNTALMLAAWKGHTNIVNLLKKATEKGYAEDTDTDRDNFTQQGQSNGYSYAEDDDEREDWELIALAVLYNRELKDVLTERSSIVAALGDVFGGTDYVPAYVVTGIQHARTNQQNAYDRGISHRTGDMAATELARSYAAHSNDARGMAAMTALENEGFLEGNAADKAEWEKLKEEYANGENSYRKRLTANRALRLAHKIAPDLMEDPAFIRDASAKHGQQYVEDMHESIIHDNIKKTVESRLKRMGHENPKDEIAQKSVATLVDIFRGDIAGLEEFQQTVNAAESSNALEATLKSRYSVLREADLDRLVTTGIGLFTVRGTADYTHRVNTARQMQSLPLIRNSVSKVQVGEQQRLVFAQWIRKKKQGGHTGCVKALTEDGADVNAKDENGETALIGAVREGHTDCVKILLNAGADINAKSKDGETALTLARRKGHTNIVRLLQEAGGKGERQKEDEIDPFGDDEEEETPKPSPNSVTPPKKQAFKPLAIRDFKKAKKDIQEAMQKAKGSERSLLDETADIADAFCNIKNDIALIRKQNAADKKQIAGLGSWVTKSSKSAGARRKIQELELCIERRNARIQKKAEDLIVRAQKAEAKLQKAGQKEYADFLGKAIRTLRHDIDRLW